jgi:hypothetical protein
MSKVYEKRPVIKIKQGLVAFSTTEYECFFLVFVYETLKLGFMIDDVAIHIKVQSPVMPFRLDGVEQKINSVKCSMTRSKTSSYSNKGLVLISMSHAILTH